MNEKTFEGSVDIDVPAEVAYSLWSDCRNFPKFIRGVHEVKRIAPNALRWLAEVRGHEMEWDAEITEDRPNERIAWRILPDGHVTGAVTFEPLSENGVRVTHALQIEKAEEDDQETMEPRLLEDLQAFKRFAEAR